MVKLPEGFSMAPDGKDTVYTPGEDAERDREYFWTHRAYCERNAVVLNIPLIVTSVVGAGWSGYDGHWLPIVLIFAAVPLLPWPMAKNITMMIPLIGAIRILPFWFAPIFRAAAAALLLADGSVGPAIVIASNAAMVVLRELMGRRDARGMGLLV